MRSMSERPQDLNQSGSLGRVEPVRPQKLPRPSLIVRFMQKVMIQPDGCWIWTAHCNPRGYGWFRHPETKYAHRASYLMFVGPIPEEADLDHLCRRPSCVNPDHLEPVSTRVNIRRGMPETWTACDRLHPDTPTRLAEKRTGKTSRMRCLECHRVEGIAVRDRQKVTDAEARRMAQMGDVSTALPHSCP